MLKAKIRALKAFLIARYMAISMAMYRFAVFNAYQVICIDAPSKLVGAELCEFLATSPAAPKYLQVIARHDTVFFAKKFAAAFPGAACEFVKFGADNGCNPSVCQYQGELFTSLRVSNYHIDRYQQRVTHDAGQISTRNFLASVSSLQDVKTGALPELIFPGIEGEVLNWSNKGVEDIRLFALGDELWCSGTIYQYSPNGMPEMMLSRILPDGDRYRFSEPYVIHSENPCIAEKNWMPVVTDDGVRLVYSLDPLRVLDARGQQISLTKIPLSLNHLRGGSQLVPFEDGYLALTHECAFVGTLRHYVHRFVKFDRDLNLTALSAAFTFMGKPIEFAVGLAWNADGKRMVASFGVNDGEAWLMAFDPDAVARQLRPIAPWRAPKC